MNVEILVHSESAPQIRAVLGDAPKFSTRPSARKAHRLLLALLADLDVPERRLGLEKLYDLVLHHPTSIMFIQIKSDQPRTSAALQALTHWARRLEAEPFVAPGADAARRVAQAHSVGAEKDLIASASVENGKLLVWSCEPKRYEVPVSELSALAGLDEGALQNFELSSSGSRIHWKAGDIDLNLDTIREHADPEVRKQHDAERRKEAARYGKAIRAFREQAGLKQSAITGLSERQVRRLEEGSTLPHANTLRKLAAAHDLSVDDYLKKLARLSSAKTRAMRGARR